MQWRIQDSSGAWAKSTHAQAICLALVMENVYACKLTHAMRALTLAATQIRCLLQTGARAHAQGRRALGPPLVVGYIKRFLHEYVPVCSE